MSLQVALQIIVCGEVDVAAFNWTLNGLLEDLRARPPLYYDSRPAWSLEDLVYGSVGFLDNLRL